MLRDAGTLRCRPVPEWNDERGLRDGPHRPTF